ncbi:MAG: response regulator [Cytophagaceae bacterium]|jgi:CheY-like chemotaxis protein|nr:response regulator [Cytophagaceae bacterium]
MLKILIVEDDKFISTILSFFAKSLGYELVGNTNTGLEALELTQKYAPDVVLMDIHLDGEIDGIQTAERIQLDFEIPVIFVSSDTSTGIVERAIVTNSYGYLVKPIQKGELGITIDLAYYKHKVAMNHKRREQSFRQFISDAAIPIVIVEGGCIRYLNRNALDIFHSHYIEDIMGLPFLNFASEGSKNMFTCVLEGAPNPGTAIPKFKAAIRGLHGADLDVLVSGSWIKFNNCDALQLVMTDITEEIKAQNAAALYCEIVKNGQGAYLELNPLFEIIDCNSAFCNLISSTIEIKGKSLFNIHPFIEADSNTMAQCIKDKNIKDFDIELRTSFLIIKCRAYIFRDIVGNAEKIGIVVLDTVCN